MENVRLSQTYDNKETVIIYGAGNTGHQLALALNSSNYKVNACCRRQKQSSKNSYVYQPQDLIQRSEPIQNRRHSQVIP